MVEQEDMMQNTEHKNPYADEQGHTCGRLGKAWAQGYAGLPPQRTWDKGSACMKAYREGKKAAKS